MKLVRFSTSGQPPRLGALQNERVADLQASVAATLTRRGVVRAQEIAAALVPASTRAFLEGGTFKGRNAVGEWFGNWFRTFEPGYHFDIEEARDLGEAILLVASHRGRGRMSGAEVHGQTSYLYRVRDGRIARADLDGSVEGGAAGDRELV